MRAPEPSVVISSAHTGAHGRLACDAAWLDEGVRFARFLSFIHTGRLTKARLHAALMSPSTLYKDIQCACSPITTSISAR
jgi:hypothetical protein